MGAGLGDQTFGSRFLAKLPNHPTQNQLASPLSAGLCLKLVADGARGRTAEEFRKALSGMSSDPKSLIADLLGSGNMTLANGVFVPPALNLSKEFTEHALDIYGAKVKRFGGKGAVAEINQWVSDSTKHRITHLIDELPMESLVLVNTLTFDGVWEKPFLPSETVPKPFHGVTRVSGVPTMHQKGDYLYREVGSVRQIELPYQGGKFAMRISLPAGSAQVSLGAAHKSSIVPFVFRKIDLELPKFTVSDSYNLLPTLQKLGLKSALDGGDFSGITPGREVTQIAQAVQKTWLSVDEKGTKAAAATAIAMPTMVMLNPPKPILFHVDHPFTFEIVHLSTKTVIFSGAIRQL
jgi:serine protease inhibitor